MYYLFNIHPRDDIQSITISQLVHEMLSFKPQRRRFGKLRVENVLKIFLLNLETNKITYLMYFYWQKLKKSTNNFFGKILKN